MQVVSLRSLVDDQHDRALASEHLVPINDLLQDGGIAGDPNEWWDSYATLERIRRTQLHEMAEAGVIFQSFSS